MSPGCCLTSRTSSWYAGSRSATRVVAEPAALLPCRCRAGYDSRTVLSCARTRKVITSSSLDPRAPLVLDIRELGRRPGSQRKVTRTVPAPAGLGIEVLRVPDGSQV